MLMRNNYGFQTQRGVPGTLYDMSPHTIDSRQNAEEVLGTMQFGVGVVKGDIPGSNVRLPQSGDTSDMFEGVSMGSQTSYMDMEGNFKVNPKQTIGLLRWGRPWVRVVADLTIQYGDPVYLVVSGDDRGLFTNEDGGTDTWAINATFVDGLGTSNVAPIQIYNQSN